MLFTSDNAILLAISLLEIFTLSLMKTDTNVAIILILYAAVGYGLRHLVRSKGLLAGNAIYDFIGILGTSIIAILYFGEKAKMNTYIGLALGGISLYLLNM